MILMVIIRYISRVLVWILTILVILGSLGKSCLSPSLSAQFQPLCSVSSAQLHPTQILDHAFPFSLFWVLFKMHIRNATLVIADLSWRVHCSLNICTPCLAGSLYISLAHWSPQVSVQEISHSTCSTTLNVAYFLTCLLNRSARQLILGVSDGTPTPRLVHEEIKGQLLFLQLYIFTTLTCSAALQFSE